MDAAARLLDEALGKTRRLSAVVDVGANPIDGDPPYASMLSAGLCTVVGFEPQPAALDELHRRAGPRETYLPYAVGDGNAHTLRITQSSGMTSILEPNPERLALFNGFSDWGKVTSEQRIETRRLDELEEITEMDLLKIDVQGAELIVFEGASERLSRAVAVHTEISFVSLYVGQPSFGQVDQALRALGFIPHSFAAIKRWAIAPVVFSGGFRVGGNQLLEADIVYVRDFGEPDAMSEDQLAHLGLIAHHVYGSIDLTHACLSALVARGVVGPAVPAAYLAALG